MSRKYVNLTVPYGVISDRSRRIAEGIALRNSSILNVAVLRDDRDWKIVEKYNPVLAVALLRDNAYPIKCQKCDHVELISRKQKIRFGVNSHLCWLCRTGNPTRWTKGYTNALKRLRKKFLHAKGLI